ncbi:membrane protein insertion efficiency factor YidD [Patescibacteria group bacterium]|nr:membrane protein insertion efficiency factor YidD [Patescibacteria group bacterium]
MKKLILNLIKFYKKHLSLDEKGVKVCRFTPTCSEYTYQAIEKYGVIKGGLMGFGRILRCNPFSKGGNDPVK